MLQTAPVLLVFPPTIGPFARVEGNPLRFDFTGYVFLLRLLRPAPISLTHQFQTARSQLTRSILGLYVICRKVLSLN